MQIGHRRDWVSIASTGIATVGMTADGSVWDWGVRADKRAKASSPLAYQLFRLGRALGIACFQSWWDGNQSLPSSASPELVLKFQASGSGKPSSDH